MSKLIPNEVETSEEKRRRRQAGYAARDRELKPERVAQLRREHRDRAKTNPKSNSEADWYMRAKFGINLDDYRAMLAAQGGVCAVCGKEPGTRRLHIDHDHATGEVRGLLCQHCNQALGFAFEDVDRLMALAAYLLSYQDILTGTEPILEAEGA